MTDNACNKPRLIHSAPLTRLFLTSHAARIASFPILISIPNQIPVSISPSAIARVSVAVSSWLGSLCYTAGASSSQMPRRSFATAEEGLCVCGLVKATEIITALRECRFIQTEATPSPRLVSFYRPPFAMLSPYRFKSTAKTFTNLSLSLCILHPRAGTSKRTSVFRLRRRLLIRYTLRVSSLISCNCDTF